MNGNEHTGQEPDQIDFLEAAIAAQAAQIAALTAENARLRAEVATILAENDALAFQCNNVTATARELESKLAAIEELAIRKIKRFAELDQNPQHFDQILDILGRELPAPPKETP